MPNAIVVYYDGSGLIISAKVAEQLKIKNGYQIKTEAEFWQIFNANASQQLAAINAVLNNQN